MTDRAAQQADLELVLTAAAVPLGSVKRGEVGATARMTPGSDTKGDVRAYRRPAFDEVDLWHANMGDRDCLALAARVEDALRGAGYEVLRSDAVPNMVSFRVPVAVTGAA